MKRLVPLLAIALAACGGGGAAPAVSVVQQPVRPCSVVLYGDSIISGYYTDITVTPYASARLVEPMAAALRRLRPAIAFEDRAVPGQNLRNVVEGFTHPDPVYGTVPAFAQQRRTADVVVLESGVIDAWLAVIDGEWPIAAVVDFDQRLNVIARQVRQEGRQLVITGLARQAVFDAPPQAFITPDMVRARDSFDDRARYVAGYLGVPFADIGAARFDGQPDILDTVHPSQAYSGRMVERIATSVDIACGRVR